MLLLLLHRSRRLLLNACLLFMTCALLFWLVQRTLHSGEDGGRQFQTRRRRSRQNGGQPKLIIEDPNGYISYLPHSGFNNQRKELENALMVAFILNRTLVIPPAYIGHADVLSWRPFDQMLFHLRLVETANYNRLFFSEAPDPVLVDHLSPATAISQVPFSTIFNLSTGVSSLVRIIDVADFIDLQVLRKPEDIALVADNERYAYRLVDHLPSMHIVDNLSNDLHLSTLYAAPSLPVVSSDDTPPPRPLFSSSHNEHQKDFLWFTANLTKCTLNDQTHAVLKSTFLDVSTNTMTRSNSHLITLTQNASHDLSQKNYFQINPCDDDHSEFSSSMRPLYPELGAQVIDFGITKYVQIPLEKYSHIINLKSNWSRAYDSYRMHRFNSDDVDNSAVELPKLIQFGSLFGTFRVELLDAKNRQVQERIKNSLIPSHPIVTSVANDITSLLGGKHSYISLHLRVGDGRFVHRAQATINRAMDLVRDWLELKPASKIYLATDDPFPMQSLLFQPLIDEFGADRIYTAQSFPLFYAKLKQFDDWRLELLASNERESGWESEMSELFDYIEDVYRPDAIPFAYRQDLPRKKYLEMIDYLKQYRLRPKNMRRQRNQHSRNNSNQDDEVLVVDNEEELELSKFAQMWVPFVDQLVCSQSHHGVGTQSSTFSGYIKRLFDNQKPSADSQDYDYILV